MSWKAEHIADSSGQWTSNQLRFATEAEALGYAKDLFARWTMVREYRATECADPVTDRWDLERGGATVLPRATEDMTVEPITDVKKFLRDLTGIDPDGAQ